MRDNKLIIILGAGVSGLAAGYASGAEMYEAASIPGGTCATYYVSASTKERLAERTQEAYRFEVGEGHWIFGGDSVVLRLIESISPTKEYERKAEVLIATEKPIRVPYPIQYNLRYLDKAVVEKIMDELGHNDFSPSSRVTMKD